MAPWLSSFSFWLTATDGLRFFFTDARRYYCSRLHSPHATLGPSGTPLCHALVLSMSSSTYSVTVLTRVLTWLQPAFQMS
ncbi:hypothetical protein EDB84DRAFT_1503450 [Lactarius hengduanensis]|nr:hypothetical protein EDB84DRAFT_1503450 [Lactarius hengduanensis]